jgi:hypothetical protein
MEELKTEQESKFSELFKEIKGIHSKEIQSMKNYHDDALSNSITMKLNILD